MSLYKFIVDTREQAPYAFKGEDTITRKLDTGDYSIEIMDVSYENEIIVERKELGDFISMCYGDNRERFLRELERSLNIPHFFIIIEGSWKQIETNQYYSKINPNSIIECILGWQIKYGCHIILTENRTRGERITKKILLHFAKYKTEKKKEKRIVEPLKLESNPIATMI